jgi:shikimate kinase
VADSQSTAIPTPDRVALVGLSGVGKSTIARRLASRWGWRAIDLDDDIASGAGCTVTEIFENHGESEFRRLERDALMRALTETQVVLATGGGAPCQPGAMDALLTHATVVWLDAAPATLADRLAGADDRPLLHPGAVLQSLEAQHSERGGTYGRAHLHVSVEGLDAEQVVDAIAAGLGHGVGA